MAYTGGRCTNVDYCGLAAARHPIEVPLGEPFICPECSRQLRAPSVQEASGGNVRVIAAVVAALLLAGGGMYAGIVLAGHMRAVSVASVPRAAAADRPPRSTAAPPQEPDRLLPQQVLATETMPSRPEPAILLRLQGSASLGAALAPKLATAFLAAQGDISIDVRMGNGPGEIVVAGLRAGQPEGIVISVQGVDAGFSALGRGDCDIAMAARRIAPYERDRLQALGDLTSAAGEHEIARRSLAVIVNPRNPLASLPQDRLRGLLNGEITNWAAFGDDGGALHVLVDDDVAAEGLEGVVPGTADLALGVRRVHDVAAEVMADRLALGVVDIADVGAAKILAIAGEESYRLTRQLYFYVAPNGNNPFVDRFVTFALSPDGQAVVAQAGLVPLQVALEAARTR